MPRAAAPGPAGAAERRHRTRRRLDDITVRPATADDIDGVVAVAQALAAGSSDADWHRKGSLVSGYPPEVYRDAVDSAALLLVATDADQVVGFLLGYPAEQAPDPAVVTAVTSSVDGPSFLVKQIGVLPSHGGRGIGAALYEDIERRTYPLHLAAAIVATPPNVPSLRFHEGQGFELATRFTAEDGRDRFLLGKRRPTSLTRNDHDTLLVQYRTAAELYRHEDRLNWTKLNNLFYVNAGLLAALGLAVQGASGADLLSRGQWWLVLLVATLGVLASLVFAFALASGTEYLQARKAAVVDLEHQLIASGGLPVVDWHLRRGSTRRLWRSRTAAMLRAVPIVVAVGWTAVAVAAVQAL